MNPAPRWFNVASSVALLWNILGCVAFVSDVRLAPEDIGRLPEAQQALYAARPGWSVVATGVAVFGGALGCIGLLARRNWAFGLLLLSLVGIIAQDIAMFILTIGDAPAAIPDVVLQVVVLWVGVLLVLLGRKAMASGWLA